MKSTAAAVASKSLAAQEYLTRQRNKNHLDSNQHMSEKLASPHNKRRSGDKGLFSVMPSSTLLGITHRTAKA